MICLYIITWTAPKTTIEIIIIIHFQFVYQSTDKRVVSLVLAHVPARLASALRDLAKTVQASFAMASPIKPTSAGLCAGVCVKHDRLNMYNETGNEGTRIGYTRVYNKHVAQNAHTTQHQNINTVVCVCVCVSVLVVHSKVSWDKT